MNTDTCSACGARVPGGSRYCPRCGASLSASTAAPGGETAEAELRGLHRADDRPPGSCSVPWTPAASDDDAVTFDGTPEVAPAGAPARDLSPRAESPAIPSPGSIRVPGRAEPAGGDGRVLDPGALLAGRYRIVALLGRGGMGEVYRADDLKLGQAVALKFLPRALERDAGRLERFLTEIRTAREVSHPNVCRVYDVGEVDGRHFLSMEYIDGEDLSLLLRRIGRLPSDKALDIARQLCAGLAAAHDSGVLHRDLKPANVMLDGRGKVRLTDFGLAEIAGSGSGSLAGTPAYMAPEQFAGQPASVQSDLYALGLVLYEVFTGKRVFVADTFAELRRMHEETRPASLTSAVHEIDPAVERVILRCLEKDPADRPVSAIAVAAALPGGDPLAAALAAGETPSPGMVAAAGEEGVIRPAVAAAWFAAVLAGIVATVLLASRLSVLPMLPLQYSPEVLESKAHEMLERLGVDAAARDSATGIEWEPGYSDYAQAHGKSAGGWKDVGTGHLLVRFWYRSSPAEMVAANPDGLFGTSATVSMEDPPMDTAGMVSVVLDVHGRLLRLEAVPTQVEPSDGAPPPAPDWRKVLAETGLDPATLVPTPPRWLPPTWADTRGAWNGTYADLPGVMTRVEAAAYRGKPVYVRVVRPWTPAERPAPGTGGSGLSVGNTISLVIVLTVLVASVAMARRNLALGRGDRRGATLTAAATGTLFVGTEALQAHHLPSANEVTIVVQVLGAALFLSTWMWLLYLALEPAVRRRWPHVIISWNRLMIGRVRDPLVGRDVLVGAALGVTVSLAEMIGRIAGYWSPGPIQPRLSPLLGLRFALNSLFGITFNAVFSVLILFFLLFLFRLVLRRDWLTAAAFIAFVTLRNIVTPSSPNPVLLLLVVTLMVVVVLRFGFVAFGVGQMLNQLLTVYPLSTDLGRWYGTPTLVAFAVAAGIAYYGFRVTLAGKSLLGDVAKEA